MRREPYDAHRILACRKDAFASLLLERCQIRSRPCRLQRRKPSTGAAFHRESFFHVAIRQTRGYDLVCRETHRSRHSLSARRPGYVLKKPLSRIPARLPDVVPDIEIRSGRRNQHIARNTPETVPRKRLERISRAAAGYFLSQTHPDIPRRAIKNLKQSERRQILRFSKRIINSTTDELVARIPYSFSSIIHFQRSLRSNHHIQTTKIGSRLCGFLLLFWYDGQPEPFLTRLTRGSR